MEEKFKSGFVSIIGRTNVGKSTLINSLTGEKVAITANKSQTTRTAIRAIINRDNSQIIFIDTPGIHKPKTKLGETMLETAYGAVTDVDVVLFMIDASRNEIPKGDKIILEKIKEAHKPTILIINKIDLIKRENLLKVIDMYRKEYDFKAVIPTSAIKSKEVNAILDEEVPHGIYVETEKMQERTTSKGEQIYDVEATIYCLRNSHKGIIIGKGGQMLKRIGTYARQDLERMLGIKINLKIWVKVREDWQEKESIVNKFKMK